MKKKRVHLIKQLHEEAPHGIILAYCQAMDKNVNETTREFNKVTCKKCLNVKARKS